MSKKSRRQFIKLAASSSVIAGAVPSVFAKSPVEILRRELPSSFSPNERVGLGLIGSGGQGMGDTLNALRVDEGVELVGVADCYDGRLRRIKELTNDQVFTSRDYREILNRDDIDAVIIATPDHWHAKITTDALAAGKAVYCEKPMVHDLSEGPVVIDAWNKAGKILQVGSQRVSSVAYEKAKELYESGAIGTLNLVQANYDRNSALGAWQYSIPPDASPETMDWEQFLGNAPKRPFDPTRFFRWRNYFDYGTGVAGDLFVHLFSGIHFVLGSNGPSKVYSTGGIRHWKDGRDAPDIQMALFDYPETKNHPAFNMSLQVNFADGAGGGQSFRFVGNEGVITISGQSVTIAKRAIEKEPGYSTWNLPSDQAEAYITKYRETYPEPDRADLSDTSEVTYRAPRGYSDSMDHIKNFIHAVRENGTVVEDAVFGYRAAAAALLCNNSYLKNEAVKWDPEKMKIA